MYDKCFQGGIIPSRKQKKAKCHEKALSLLQEQKTQLKELIDELVEAEKRIVDTFQGVSSVKMQHEKSWSKKENLKKNRKRKLLWDDVNCMGLLRKITKPGVAEKCFPEGDCTSQSSYTVQITDVADDIYSKIRPQRDQRYVKILIQAKAFNDQVLSYVRGCFNMKFKDTYKTPKKSSEPESEPEEQVTSMYIPVDLQVEHDSSDDESDPFDLLEVHPMGDDFE